MKKKYIGLTLALLCWSLVSFAQGKEAMREKVEARRVAFITDKLQLTPEEAQQFWPLYNEFQEKRKALNREHRGKVNLQSMSDEELEVFVEQELQKEEQQLALRKEYTYKLKKVLPIRKLAMLPRVENRFKQWMLRQIKERRGNR